MNELIKPTFDLDVEVKIPKDMPVVEHNLDILEEYAKKLNEFYSSLIIQKEDIKDAEAEKAKINNLIKTVKRLRIDSVKEYKKPIDDFEATAKRVESLLTEASETLKNTLDIYDGERQEDKINKVIKPIITRLISDAFVKGYLIDPDKIEENPKWLNKTYKEEDIEKDIQMQIDKLIIDSLSQVVSFRGNEEQVNNLRAYAKELGMEEI